jgi:site-specific recombinase XerD
MTITAILKGRKDKDGRLTVTLRMQNGADVRKFKAMPLRIHPDNFKNGTVINHPQAVALNKKIAQWIREAELSFALKPLNKFPDADFKQYGYECLRQWDKAKKPSTLTQIKGEVDRFVKFAGDLKLSRVTIGVLNEYKTHILKTRTTNTAWKTFKCLKVIINKAVKEKVIEENPFDMFENVKYQNPKKEWLNRDEIERINEYVQRTDTPKRIAFIGNWFLIGCYTGLRYSDMNNFNAKHHIKNGRLTLYTTKTNEVVSLPLADIKYLFDRVGNKPLDVTNQKYNEYLKVLAQAVDLPAISGHWSRHSFAVMCASAGLSPEVTAKLMGITNLRTVAVYYKITTNRTDEEYKKLF